MITTNSSTYEGIVKLNIINSKTKKIKKSITIHNEGTERLFYFLCKCLSKQYDPLLAPLAVDASDTIYDKSNSDTLKSSLAYRAVLSPQGVVKDTKYIYVARFSTIIPFAAVVTKGTLKCFQLCSSLSQKDKVGSLLAYLNYDEGVEIKDGEALLIEWNMGFKNPSSSNLT